MKNSTIANSQIKSQILCDFIRWTFDTQPNGTAFDFHFLLKQLNFTKGYHKLNSNQLLALCFQYLIFIPMEPYHNAQYSLGIMKKFFKNLQKDKLTLRGKSPIFVYLPESAFSSLHFRKAMQIIKEINTLETKKLSQEAKTIWDLNHFYFALPYEDFIEFIDQEYESVQDTLSEDEYLYLKKQQFKNFLLSPQVYQTKKFVTLFEKNARINFNKFLAQIETPEKIHYNS